MGAGTGFNQAPPSGGGGSVVAVLGTPDRITSSGGTSPTIDISATFEGTLEKVVNKSTDVDTDKASNTKYPSVKSVYDWAVSIFQTLANKDASGGYVGLTLFKINFKNTLNTFTSFFLNNNSAARTYTFQDRDGTIADDTDLAGKVSSVSGTANQIGSTGGITPVISIVSNAILPGSPTIVTPGNSTQNIITTDATQTLSNKTFVAPALGTPVSGVATNLTGTAAGLTAGNVTTNANLTGPITSIGNATTIANSVALPGSPTTATQSANDNSTKVATTAYADAKVADAINNGTTTVAPSQNAVFDALALKEPISNQASISASAIDWNVTHSYKTLSANTTFTFSNAADAKTIIVAITNTASNYTVTWPTVKWYGGVAPVQTVGAKTDIYTFVQINSVIYGSYVQNLS